MEGTDSFIAINIERDLEVYAGEIVLEYATSDLTAKGVDTDKFDECLTLPTVQRNAAGCYHYEQTSGVVTIAAGSSTGGFTVRIMNDLCRQHYFRNLQLTISVPGSASLQGESMQSMLRIDDDDFILSACEL